MRSDDAPLFPYNPWAYPEQRPRLFAEALREPDREGLMEGFRFYLQQLGRSEGTVRSYATLVRHALDYFQQGLGRSGLNLARGDILQLVDELKASKRSEARIVNLVSAIRMFANFVGWCGQTFPQVDMPDYLLPRRKAVPYQEAEVREILAGFTSWKSIWKLPLEAVVRLLIETGLDTPAVRNLKLHHYEAGDGLIQLPGGRHPLSRPARTFFEAFLAWRDEVKRPGFSELVLSPAGMRLQARGLYDARRMYAEFLGMDMSFTRLRLYGGRRMVERYGLPRARRLLGRTRVF